jgi:hypothetical protein
MIYYIRYLLNTKYYMEHEKRRDLMDFVLLFFLMHIFSRYAILIICFLKVLHQWKLKSEHRNVSVSIIQHSHRNLLTYITETVQVLCVTYGRCILVVGNRARRNPNK